MYSDLLVKKDVCMLNKIYAKYSKHSLKSRYQYWYRYQPMVFNINIIHIGCYISNISKCYRISITQCTSKPDTISPIYIRIV